MFAKGLVLVYPNFPDQQSFSTNHYEEGIHSVPEGMETRVPDVLREAQDERFLVPLLGLKDAVRVSSSFPRTYIERVRMEETGAIPWISLYNQVVNGSDILVTRGREWLEGVEKADPVAFKLLNPNTSSM